jgi:hypothetical protein
LFFPVTSHYGPVAAPPRDPPVLWVGLVLGLAVLVNQESPIMATILVLLALIPGLAARPSLDRLRDCAIAALATLVVASPQIAAMAWQANTEGTAATGSITGLAGSRCPGRTACGAARRSGTGAGTICERLVQNVLRRVTTQPWTSTRTMVCQPGTC